MWKIIGFVAGAVFAQVLIRIFKPFKPKETLVSDWMEEALRQAQKVVDEK